VGTGSIEDAASFACVSPDDDHHHRHHDDHGDRDDD